MEAVLEHRLAHLLGAINELGLGLLPVAGDVKVGEENGEKLRTHFGPPIQSVVLMPSFTQISLATIGRLHVSM